MIAIWGLAQQRRDTLRRYTIAASSLRRVSTAGISPGRGGGEELGESEGEGEGQQHNVHDARPPRPLSTLSHEEVLVRYPPPPRHSSAELPLAEESQKEQGQERKLAASEGTGDQPDGSWVTSVTVPQTEAATSNTTAAPLEE